MGGCVTKAEQVSGIIERKVGELMGEPYKRIVILPRSVPSHPASPSPVCRLQTRVRDEHADHAVLPGRDEELAVAAADVHVDA